MKQVQRFQDYNQDPACFAVNACAPHAAFSSQFSAGALPQGLPASGEINLNGVWKMQTRPNLQAGPDACFYDAADLCEGWAEMPVPAHPELHGVGAPQYVNVMYPWDGVEALAVGQVPIHSNPVYYYVTSVQLPACTGGEMAYLRFEGVASCAAVWVNGCFCGYCEDSFTPSEFEVSRFLKAGTNKIAVQVAKWCSGSWMEDQDFWRLSGIFRGVTLRFLPATHIQDIDIRYELDVAQKSAVLCATLTLALSEESGVVECVLRRGLSEVARAPRTIVQEKKEDGKCSLTLSAQDLLLWSAEQPNLYELCVQLSGARGVQTVCCAVGFRRIEIVQGLLLCNQKRLSIRGVNRHEFSLANGRAITRADMEWDVRTMKRLNINAVRTSHYPNDPYFYHLCDVYGLYVIDEVNLETQGTWNHLHENSGEYAIPHNDALWTANALARAEALYQRDKNCTSVILWSLGNESYGGEAFLRMHEFFKKNDSTRPVHYEGVVYEPQYEEATDIHSTMYFSVEQAREYLENSPQKPYIQCEYSHAMGNSCGALFKYTDLEKQYPMYQGGLIWDFIDQALLCKDAKGALHPAYGGDFDDRPHDGVFCGNGIVFADRTLSPKAQEVRFCYQPVDICLAEQGIEIKNRFLFLSLEEFEWSYQLCDAKNVVFQMPLHVCCAPLESVRVPRPKIDFTLPHPCTETVCMRLKHATAWAGAGYELAWMQRLINRPQWTPVQSAPPELIEGDYNLGVRAGGVSLLFHKKQGMLYSYRCEGVELLSEPVRPNFWRAPTDNDNGWEMPRKTSVWRAASDMPVFEGYTVTWEAGLVCITLRYQLFEGAVCSLSYGVRGDGAVRVTYHYYGAEGLPIVPEHAVVFVTKPRYDQVCYYGAGPEENYIDRCSGALLGSYKTTAKQNLTPYLNPQECGMRTSVYRASVCDPEGKGLFFAAEKPVSLSVLPYLPNELAQAKHRQELPGSCKTVARICGWHMGVGGDDSWQAMPHPEYQLSGEKDFSFQFWFGGRPTGMDCLTYKLQERKDDIV